MTLNNKYREILKLDFRVIWRVNFSLLEPGLAIKCYICGKSYRYEYNEKGDT